jgi:hypothetical protein
MLSAVQHAFALLHMGPASSTSCGHMASSGRVDEVPACTASGGHQRKSDAKCFEFGRSNQRFKNGQKIVAGPYNAILTFTVTDCCS